jgi:hypothetical protein
MVLERVLIVEDNREFLEAGMKYVSNQGGMTIFSPDYVSANNVLDNSKKYKIDGAMIDCFFREHIHSTDTSRGKEAINKMLDADPRGQRIERYERAFEQILDITDPELRRLVRYIGSHEDKDNPMENVIFRAMNQVGNLLGKEENSRLQKQNLVQLFRKELDNFKDHYDELRKAVEKDPSNQPLGILVAERCEELKIPFVLTTSTFHHDSLTQPIQDYCSKRGWNLIDSSPNRFDEKVTPEFWKRAYDLLSGSVR